MGAALGYYNDEEGAEELEQALRNLPADQALVALELIERVTQNVIKDPRSEKYRKIKLDNPKTAEALTKVPGAVEALKVAGWVEGVPGSRTLSLPHAVCPTPREVVQIHEAKDHYRRERANSDPERKVKDILAGF